jgi:hypothetical protein
MRWKCLILSASVVAFSPLAFAQNPGPAKAIAETDRLYLPSQALYFTSDAGPARSMVGNAEVHTVELQGVGVSQVPEPSSMAVFGLLATPFLIRRRRKQLG